MANLFDYLLWRGDLSFAQTPFCAVDGLILSALTYVHFESLVPEEAGSSVPLGDAAEAFLSLPGEERGRVRCENDLRLLELLARAPRFAPLRLACREERFDPAQESQFAALTVLLSETEAFLAFRGTDSTLVGWKEDFNMGFMDAVPAQEMAREYVERFAAAFPGVLRLGGHSKGGNLAVYAAARASEAVQARIEAVYNNDGPGFTDAMVESAGYQRILPKVHTWLPQFSVVGMLLEHREACTVLRSDRQGLLQHDPYSWQVLGGDFVSLEEVTPGSRVTDRALRSWISGMTPEQRGRLVDTVYDILSAGDATRTSEIVTPANLSSSLHALNETDAETRRLLADTLGGLLRSAAGSLAAEIRPRPELLAEPLAKLEQFAEQLPIPEPSIPEPFAEQLARLEQWAKPDTEPEARAEENAPEEAFSG